MRKENSKICWNAMCLALMIFCLGAHAQNADNGVPDADGLAAWWSFDTARDGVVSDQSGNGNDGKLMGGAKLVPGIRGKALSCNGVDAYLACGWDAALNSPTALTVEAWVHPKGTHQKGYGGIINNLNGSSNSRLLLNDGGALLAQLHGTSSSVSGPVLLDDLWNHVVYVFNGTEECWYLNGRQTHAAPFVGPLPSGSAAPTIGWGFKGPDFYHFRGLIDEVRIYRRALNAQAVSIRYEKLAGPVKAKLVRRRAEQQRASEVMDFVDHGVPARLGTRRGLVATCDANGRPLVLICSMDNFKRTLRSSLLVVDVLSGVTEQYWYPKREQPVGEDYALLLARSGMFYTMFGPHFLEFDPTARAWTFSRLGPGMAMSFTEAPDGTIYAATYPGSHLVSFNPKTRAFTNHGSLDPTEKYPRSLAVDDAGWVYCGIGVAKSTLVAYNPRTGERHRLPDDGPRKPGAAAVFRALNGRAYAYLKSGGQCYELFEGKATPIAKPAAAKDPIKTASQGSFFPNFPDGRRVAGVSLAEKWLDVAEPEKGPTRRIELTYDSEGPGILSVLSGPDGLVYGSTGLPLHVFSYDIENDYLEDMGEVRHGAHYNALTLQGHRIVGAAYCGGFLSSYDTRRPWTNEIGPTPNPVFHGNWARDLTRPAALLAHPDGKHVVMGGMPAYGYCGGGLLIYDLAADTHQLLTHEQVLPGLSTMALAALPDGNVVGGASTAPGTGGHAVATEGALYLFDWKQRKVVFQTHVSHAASVSEVKVGANGLVYGFAGGKHFFVFDPKRREMVHEEDLGQYGQTAGGQAPRMLLTGPDGKFYALFNRNIVRIDPETFEHESVLRPPAVIGAGIAIEKGRIFFGSGSRLCSCRLPLADPAPPTTLKPVWRMLRSGTQSDRTIVSLHCSSPDGMQPVPATQNALAIDVAGKWLVQEASGAPGGDDKAGWAGALLVNGQGQTGTGSGRFLGSFLSPGYRYVLGDATSAYKPGLLSRHHRHLFSLGPDLFVVMDEVATPAPANCEWRLPGGKDAEMTPHGSGAFVGQGSVSLKVAMVGHANDDVRVHPADGGVGAYLSVAGRPAVSEQLFRCVLRQQVTRKATAGVLEVGRLPVVASSEREQRLVRGAGITGIFYRGKEAGDFITFEVSVPKTGTFEVVGCHYQSPLYGTLQLKVDGKPQGNPYDGYGRSVDVVEGISYGTCQLTEGKHTFRYEITGRNKDSGGHLAGILSIQLLETGDAENVVAVSSLGFQTSPLETPTAVGLSVTDPDGKSIILLGRAKAGREAKADACQFIGGHAAIRTDTDGTTRMYALYRGTQLSFGGRRLVSAEKECSASIAIEGRALTGLVKLEEAGIVHLHVPRLNSLRIRGRETPLSDVYTAGTSQVSLTLQPGSYAITGELAPKKAGP